MDGELSKAKGVEMARVYHKCHFCGGKVSEKKITVDYRWGAELVTIIKNVPAGVCEVCGEEYLKGPIVKAMERLVRSKSRPKELIKVPVRELKVA
jgi:YgiT-type zinc finger domain-containing protein